MNVKYLFIEGVRMKQRTAIAVSLALSLCGCSALQNVTSAPGTLPSGKAPTASQSTARTLHDVHALLPSGTRIYRGTTIVIHDGTNTASFPGDAKYDKRNDGTIVTYNGRSYKFSASSSMTIQNGAEYYVLPNQQVPRHLQGLSYVRVGQGAAK